MMMTLHSNNNHIQHLLSSYYIPRTMLSSLNHRTDLFLPARHSSPSSNYSNPFLLPCFMWS